MAIVFTPASQPPTHEIRRHDVKQVIHLPGFLSIHLAAAYSCEGCPLSAV
jgi:hypothetical protein